MGTKVITVTDRFWKYVEVRSIDECWPWIGYRNKRGYGVLFVRMDGETTVTILAHRFSYELVHGEGSLADALCCHSCDTPQCVNPAHLFRGTNQDNRNDCVSKGRHARGEGHPCHKLDATQVKSIRLYGKNGWSHRKIGQHFCIDHRIVGRILANELWTHV
jgi:hypothetical protein